MKADAVEKRAEDIEVALRKIVEKNFWLSGKVAELEAQSKRNVTACEENSHLQKAIKELKARLEVEKKQRAKAASKAVEDFQASEEYAEKRTQYSADAYDVER